MGERKMHLSIGSFGKDEGFHAVFGLQLYVVQFCCYSVDVFAPVFSFFNVCYQNHTFIDRNKQRFCKTAMS
jgi:hypothetical protein